MTQNAAATTPAPPTRGYTLHDARTDTDGIWHANLHRHHQDNVTSIVGIERTPDGVVRITNAATAGRATDPTEALTDTAAIVYPLDREHSVDRFVALLQIASEIAERERATSDSKEPLPA